MTAGTDANSATRMQAMVCRAPGQALVEESRPIPEAASGQILVRVLTCGVCRTDLHLRDNELPDIPYPVVPGHQVVGEVAACGPNTDWQPGQRVGLAWLAWTCGECAFCLRGQENLCDRAQFHGYQRDGGYAEFVLADADFAIPLARSLDPLHTAPLLCGGLIGYRTLRMAGDAGRLGIYGFGSAAHMIAQVARDEGRSVYAFTSPGDREAQDFALRLGAAWAGGSDQPSPEELDAALIFAPVGALVPVALRAVRKGGCVVCGGIHMSDIPSFAYRDLWGERQLRSVANLTREDAREFMQLAAAHPIRTEVSRYPLSRANDALEDLQRGRLQGSAVLEVSN